MKKAIFFLFSFIYAFSFSQSDTEVYLFDINKSNNGYSLSNQKNIPNNPGYDSQPHFYDAQTLLFSSTRNGQTDIAKYDIKTGAKIFINSTPGGGEYSPQRIPKSDHVSAVRLDTTGLQRVYKYDIKTGASEELISDLKVAYPFWYDKNTTVAAVIGNNNLYQAVSNPKQRTNATIQTNVGRSIHQIPNSKNVSFISKKTPNWEIHSLDMKKLRSTKITDIEGNYEDICWMPDGTILLAKENQILRFNPKTNNGWKVLFTLKNLEKISRIIVNSRGTKIAIVAQKSN